MSEPDHDEKSQTVPALNAGTQVGRYRIIKKQGGGAIGDVYLAQDEQSDREVALKFLASDLCRDEECHKRFRHEALAATRLDDANIAKVYEVGDYQGRPFVAAQFIEGPDLGAYAASTKLSIKEITGLGVLLGGALREAHRCGVVHGNLKPADIVMDKEGKPRIVDFGLAAVASDAQRSQAGLKSGDPAFIAPEQFEGKPADDQSDLFSLGAILYELSTGKAPFERDDPAASRTAVIEHDPQPPSRLRHGVPNELDFVIMKLLEKDRDLRYQSAAAMLSDLTRLQDSVSPGTAAPPKDWWNRYVVTAAVIFLLAIAIYWLITTYFTGSKPSPNLEPDVPWVASIGEVQGARAGTMTGGSGDYQALHPAVASIIREDLCILKAPSVALTQESEV